MQQSGKEKMKIPLLDFYNDDDVELEFLLTKPACFIIIGKPFCGKSTLAKKLAKDWNCPLIDPDILVNDEIEKQSEIGLLCKNCLEKGLEIEQDLILGLLQQRLNTSLLANTGYVLDGFPTISDSGMRTADQMVLIQSCAEKPNVVVHITMKDDDIIKRRANVRMNALTGAMYVQEEIAPIIDIKEQKSEQDSIMEFTQNVVEFVESEDLLSLPVSAADEFDHIDPAIIPQLVALPKPLLQLGIRDLQRYKRKFPILQNYLMDFPRSMILELNGNLPPQTLFKGLQSTLKMMPLSKPIYPITILDDADLDIGGALAVIDFETVFNTLRNMKKMAPFFGWRLSKWGQFCPIKMKQGWMILGKPQYSIAYRDKIYFLSDEDALKIFTVNPRPYLLPPMPVHPCKFFVFGHLKTGRSRLCRKLAPKYKGKVIDSSSFIQRYQKEMNEQYVEDVWYNTLTMAIAEIQSREVILAAVRAEQKRASKLVAKATEMAQAAFKSQKKPRKSTVSAASKTKVNKSRSPDSQQSFDPNYSYEELFLKALQSEDLASQVDETIAPLQVSLVDEDHPEVVAIVDDAVQEAENSGITIENEDFIRQLMNEIDNQRVLLSNYGAKEIREGGWIIDNFPHDKELFETALQMGLVPSCVIILKDPTENYKVVCNRWMKMRQRKKSSERDDNIADEYESEDTRSETLPDLEQLMEDEVIIDYMGEEEEGVEEIESEREQQPQVELAPKLTEVELTLVNLRGTLNKLDSFYEILPSLLSSDGTVTIINVAITTRTNVEIDNISDLYEDLEHSFVNSEYYLLRNIGSSKISQYQLHGISDNASKLLKTPDEIVTEVIRNLESQFYYKRRIFDQSLKEQEEIDIAENTDVIFESDLEAENKLLWPGDSGRYCPVELKEAGILKSGNREIEVKYKDKSYTFASEGAQEAFISKPLEYVANKEPLRTPPIRICVTGPTGAGKSTQCRLLASKLNIFHIDFRERLQEILAAKAGRKLGFPYQIDQEQIDTEEAIMEAESRIESIITSLDRTSKETSDRSVTATLSSGRTDDMTVKSVEDTATTAQYTSSEDTIQVTPSRRPSVPVSPESTSPKAQSFREISSSKSSVATTATVSTVVPKEKFTEEEKNIKEYLQKGTALLESTLLKMLSPWWNQEPFCSVGFVLDGFPSQTYEADYMVNRNFIPDTLLFLEVTDIDVIQRLHEICMTKWKARMNLKMLKRQEQQRQIQESRDAAIASRREQLERERKKIDDAREDTILETEGDTEETEIESNALSELDIEAVLEEEFPIIEPVEELDETAEDAELRYNNNLLQLFQEDEARISEIRNIFELVHITCHAIDAKKKVDKIEPSIRKAILPFLEDRESLFEQTYPITLTLAEKLINNGHKAKSKFGMWCPVQVFDGLIIPTRYNEQHQPLAVLHRHHIYFLSSEAAKNKFMQNPLKYIRQPFPQPIVPFTISVVGPPKCGKTTLAKRFCKEFDLVQVSEGEAIRYVMNKMPSTSLCEEIKENLNRGETVPGLLVSAAVDEILSHPLCQQQGVVLDGIPLTMDAATGLSENGIIPFCVFELELSLEDSVSRYATEKFVPEKPVSFSQSPELLRIQYTLLMAELEKIRSHYKNKHHNWSYLDGTKSKWWIWKQASTQFLTCSKSVQTYVVNTQRGQAASVANLGISTEEFRANLGIYGYFCPVSLTIDGELFDCSHLTDNRYAADYNGKFYSMCCQEHLDMFLAEPDIFLPPKSSAVIPPPSELPEALTLQETIEMNLPKAEFGGYCPVTYLQGLKTYEALMKGSPKFSVLYCSRLFVFASEHKRQLFMRKPDKYKDLTVPHKRPPREESVNIFALPNLGYLEQTVSTALIKALTAVAERKPKYPFIDARRSAALFVAYYLKAHNTKASQFTRDKYQQKLLEYEDHCQLLQYVIKHMTRLPTKPNSRPEDFDQCLKDLFQLKPEPNWLFNAPTIPHPGYSL